MRWRSLLPAARTETSASRCGHQAVEFGWSLVCDLPAGHRGYHQQTLQVGRVYSYVTWGDDGLLPDETDYPENGSYPHRSQREEAS